MAHKARIEQLWPLLFTTDLNRSLEFYRDQLGFTVVAQAVDGDRVTWCRLERDGVPLMLQQAEPEDGPNEGRGRGVVLFFVCDDVDAFFEEFSAAGVRLKQPTDAHYGMRQIFVPDPDGYDICFESPITRT